MSSKTEIIPVTSEIRKYLRDIELNDREKEKFFPIVRDGYYLKKERSKYVISNDKCNSAIVDMRMAFYKDVANKIDKSLVWVYQQLVLDGYGNYISSDSDVYRTAALAYSDMEYFIDNNDTKGLECYESYCLNNKYYVVNNKCKKINKIR